MRLARISLFWALVGLTPSCSGDLGATDDSARGAKDRGASLGPSKDSDTSSADPDDGLSGSDSLDTDPESSASTSQLDGDPQADGQPSTDPQSNNDASGSGNPVAEVCDADATLALTRESLRLNDWQFQQAITELLPGADVDFALDSTIVGDNLFSTYPGANEILFNHAQTLVEKTEELGLWVSENLDQVLPCDVNSADAACVEQFIIDFGARAFRRPLSSEEVQHYQDVYNELSSGSDALEVDLAVGGLVQALLLAPDTLYLLERAEPSAVSGVLVLNNYEIASRLSFLLWNAPPDKQLLKRAAAGELQQPDTLTQEAERLLSDARSEAAVSRFMMEWFGVLNKDFSDQAPANLTSAWEEEVRRFVGHVFNNAGTLTDLLDNTEGFVNQSLAEHYGISSPSTGDDDWQLVQFPSERSGGLLTTAQFAAATSRNNATSIIHRGKAVRERLLCGQLGTPDPAFLNVDLMLEEDATVRDRMDARMGIGTCAGCHALMDPIGIGMEDLDASGRFRTQYDSGLAVDSEGEIVGTNLEPSFNGVVELAHRLAQSSEFQGCATTQWLHYAIGRSQAGTEQACVVKQMQDAWQSTGGTLRDLILSAIQSSSFVYRTQEDAQ